MAQQPSVQAVEEGDDYIHVRFRDPDEFETIRTPDWAQNAAESVVSNAEVRMGKKPNDDWEVQSVLIPKDVGEHDAKSKAEAIVEKIRS